MYILIESFTLAAAVVGEQKQHNVIIMENVISKITFISLAVLFGVVFGLGSQLVSPHLAQAYNTGEWYDIAEPAYGYDDGWGYTNEGCCDTNEWYDIAEPTFDTSEWYDIAEPAYEYNTGEWYDIAEPTFDTSEWYDIAEPIHDVYSYDYGYDVYDYDVYDTYSYDYYTAPSRHYVSPTVHYGVTSSYAAAPRYEARSNTQISNTNTTVDNSVVQIDNSVVDNSVVDNSINNSFNSGGYIGVANPQPIVVQPYYYPTYYPETLTCSLTLTQNSYGNAVLHWTTQGATRATINNGVGSVSVGSGSRAVGPAYTPYTMTVWGTRGNTTTCAASANYTPHRPNVTVDIAHVPYTGVDPLPYTLGLIATALAAGAALFVFRRRLTPVFGAFAPAFAGFTQHQDEVAADTYQFDGDEDDADSDDREAVDTLVVEKGEGGPQFSFIRR